MKKTGKKISKYTFAEKQERFGDMNPDGYAQARDGITRATLRYGNINTMEEFIIFDSELTEEILQGLSMTSSLCSVELIQISINDEGAEELISALRTNPLLERLRIQINEDSELTDKGMQTIIKFINETKLEELYLTLPNNKFSYNTFAMLASTIGNSENLKSLRLSYTNINRDNIKLILEHAANIKNLEIDLSYSDMNDEDIIAIAKTLESGTKIKSINLTGNNITDRGAKALAQAIAGNLELTLKINLNDNKITDIGVLSLQSNIDKMREGAIKISLNSNITETKEIKSTTIEKSLNKYAGKGLLDNEDEKVLYYDCDEKSKEIILRMINSIAKNRFGQNYQGVYGEGILSYLSTIGNNELTHAREALELLSYDTHQKDEDIIAYFQNDHIISEFIESCVENPDIYLTKERIPRDNDTNIKEEVATQAYIDTTAVSDDASNQEASDKNPGFFAKLFASIANFFKSIGRFFKNLFSSKKEDEAKPQRAPSVEVQSPAIKENTASNKAHSVNIRHAKTVRFTEQSRLASTNTKSTPAKSLGARPH